MEYVIAAVVVLLLVGGFAVFLVLKATGRGGAPAIGTDETPLGDTEQHAGEQTEAGTTVHDPEQKPARTDDPDAAAHVGRPGEGEGRERLEFEGERPDPER
jgi:hypothetical protein